jgi:hypothetical protein
MTSQRAPAGRWRPDRWNLAVALMGNLDLDFTQAILEEGETVLAVGVVMGGARIHVPPDVDVVADGLPIMGTLRVTAGAGGLEPLPRRLRITGVVLMGDLRVEAAGQES